MHISGRTSGAFRVCADLLRASWFEYERDRARYLAVAMVYYAIVSLVPLLLLLLSALGLLLRFSTVAAEAQQQVLLAVETSFGEELSATIDGLLESLQEQSIMTTALSVAGLLVTASVLFKHLRLSFRVIWKYEAPLVSGSLRNVLLATALERIVAFIMVLGGGALLLAALVVIATTQWVQPLLETLPLGDATAAWVLPTMSSLLVVALTFAVLFKFLPPVTVRWRDTWPSVLLCVVVWAAVGELLVLYGVLVGSNPSASGAIGALLAIMLWMNIVSQSLFFGAELCKVVATRRATPGPSPSANVTR